MPKKRNPGGCACCDGGGPECRAVVCAAARSGCTGDLLAGATVELIQGGSTIATETPHLQIASITLIGGGSGYTNGTGYVLGITGGGASTLATATFNVVGGAVSAIFLTSGGNGYTSSPTLSFAAAGGSGATATATTGAYACFHGVPYGSGYTLKTSAPDHLSVVSAPFSVPPCTNRGVTTLPVGTRTLAVSNVWSCGDVAGVEVEAEQNGVVVTETTDAAGNLVFPGKFFIYDAVQQPWPITLTFRHPSGRFVERTYVFNLVSSCFGFNLDAASISPPIFRPSSCASGTLDQGDVHPDYVCPERSSACAPLAKVLPLSDSLFGAATLNYMGCMTDLGGSWYPYWEGTLSAPVATCVDDIGVFVCIPPQIITCPAVTVTVTYRYFWGNLRISWLVHREECVPPSSSPYLPNCAGPGTDQVDQVPAISAGDQICPPSFLSEWNVNGRTDPTVCHIIYDVPAIVSITE